MWLEAEAEAEVEAEAGENHELRAVHEVKVDRAAGAEARAEGGAEGGAKGGAKVTCVGRVEWGAEAGLAV